MLSPFVEMTVRLAAAADLPFRRFLYERIDWDTRLFALVGSRGVGKTTMLLQRYREAWQDPARCLYVSADHVATQAVGLYEIAGEFFRSGGEMLFVDEVHRYPGWAAEIKSIHDAFPRGRVGITGSLMLDIIREGADLSRRMVTYHLPGMSFREFLSLETGLLHASVDLSTLLNKHPTLAAEILSRFDGSIIKRFREYLDHGFYPFYREGTDLFPIRLANVVEKIVSEDIPSVMGIRPGSIPLLRKLIHLVASSQPFPPNIKRIAVALGTSREFVYSSLEYLQRAGLFALLPPPGRGLKAVRKPAKVYLGNPNLFPAILGSAGLTAWLGAVRETFFLSQVGQIVSLTSDPKMDFRSRDGLGFEVGGRSKGVGQIHGDPNAWLAVDDTEASAGRRVPLWLFGFLY